ncbi:hypothetical protein D3C81_1705230 [compost metagenome]
MAKANFDRSATISGNGHRMLTESVSLFRYNLGAEVISVYIPLTFAKSTAMIRPDNARLVRDRR